MSELTYIEKNNFLNPEFAIIWLHGLGADGKDFLPIVDQLNWPQNLAIKFIFPNAPFKKVTINMGLKMRAWYDIISADITKKINAADYVDSTIQVQKIIQICEDAGIKSEHIIIAGFSQGAALALNVALSYKKRLAGAILLSGYLIDEDLIIKNKNSNNAKLDFFVGHGKLDEVVPYGLAADLVNFLTAQHHNIEFKSYDHPHSVSNLEFNDIQQWLIKKLDPQKHKY